MKGFSSKSNSIDSRCVIGPEDIPFSGASVHLSARKLLQAGAVKGLRQSRPCDNVSAEIGANLENFVRDPDRSPPKSLPSRLFATGSFTPKTWPPDHSHSRLGHRIIYTKDLATR